jgi:hypothetical protein
VILRGPRGSGKSALLDEVARRFKAVPQGGFDFDASGTVRPRIVVTSLAFQLARKVGQFGRLSFPRLLLGLLAIDCDIPLKDHDEALAALRKQLDEDHRLVRLRAVVTSLSEEMVRGQVLPPGSKTATDLGLDLLAALVFRRVLRGAGLAWYGRSGDDPYDALVHLNWLDHDHAGQLHEADKVDDVLCGAFLADLRAAFTQARGAGARTCNCIVRLDNVDADRGRFLDALVRARHDHAERTHADCDPMLVLATSRRRADGGHAPLGMASFRGTDQDVRTPETASYDDWERHRPRPRTWGSWLYRVRLRDLTLEEVDGLVRGAGAARHHGPFVHGLTSGHPWAVELLLATLSAAGDVDPDGIDLRGVLDWAVPAEKSDHAASDTFAARALTYLLRDLEASLRPHLVTGASASNLADMVHSDTLRPVLPDIAQQLHAMVTDYLWVDVDGRALHPMLRRLLLHELAGRDDRDPNSWGQVHSRLRDLYRMEGNEARALYHDLALCHVRPTVDHLRAVFDRQPRATREEVLSWRADLVAITSAPYRPPATLSPREHLAELVTMARKGTELDAAVAILALAMWIAGDPLGDPHGTLDTLIKDSSMHLRSAAWGAFDFLFDDWSRLI